MDVVGIAWAAAEAAARMGDDMDFERTGGKPGAADGKRRPLLGRQPEEVAVEREGALNVPYHHRDVMQF